MPCAGEIDRAGMLRFGGSMPRSRIQRRTCVSGGCYLRERQAAAQPLWIPATVLHREISAQGYQSGMSQLRRFMRGVRPTPPVDPVVRFETAPGVLAPAEN